MWCTMHVYFTSRDQNFYGYLDSSYFISIWTTSLQFLLSEAFWMEKEKVYVSFNK